MESIDTTYTKKRIPLKRRGRFSSPVWLNFLYLPTIVLLLTFIVYPLLNGIKISFTDWDGFSQTWKWFGFGNYRRMLGEQDVWIVIKNTFIYGIGSTFFQNLIGLMYALFLNYKMRTAGIAKTIIYLPVIISPLIMGYIWYFFFQYNGGAINDIIHLFQKETIDLLANSKINVWMITFVNTYQFLGIAMIIFLAGLQTIPKDYYEAADIDGASAFSKFKQVTLPLLSPAITISVVLNLIGGLRLYDVIMSLTKGGPGFASSSLSSYMYRQYFTRQDAGFASSIGILMFVLISIISLSALYFLRKRELEL
ncbi:carbohydrate ABC transporter permease [Paenibacillus aceris]|uniref:Raffinose/stachyose/melibiose transport system permease protein n=1 Tax=Paenibacillus aceris TaxID=869555 RepID=A0ABS4HXN1_9BACL|nr:sugar ABC transporter permease [Paenibacillus aceris]MBP1963387.1 raffinose/stachyose/melibiose transport system permease protein [Paenibacillus aceris]NHW36106.1 sugar ABC transporter permease [Paenibacillus aceris]